MINWRHWRTELFCIQVESFLSIFHKLINSFCLVGQAYWVLMDYIHTFFHITFDLVFSAGTPCGWMIVSSFGDLFGVIVKSCFWITISSIIYFQSLFLFRELRCVSHSKIVLKTFCIYATRFWDILYHFFLLFVVWFLLELCVIFYLHAIMRIFELWVIMTSWQATILVVYSLHSHFT